MSLFGDSKRRFNRIEKERTSQKFKDKVNKILDKEWGVHEKDENIDIEVVDEVLTMSEIFSGKYQDTRLWGRFKELFNPAYPFTIVFKIKRNGPWVLTNAIQGTKLSGKPRIEIPAKGTVQNAYIYPLELFCKEFKKNE